MEEESICFASKKQPSLDVNGLPEVHQLRSEVNKMKWLREWQEHHMFYSDLYANCVNTETPTSTVWDGSELKKDFIPLLEDWSIKPVCTTIKNPQSNAPIERIHQVLRQMFLTKNLPEQTLDYIDQWLLREDQLRCLLKWFLLDLWSQC